MVAMAAVSGNEMSVASSAVPKHSQGMSCGPHRLSPSLSILMLTRESLNISQDENQGSLGAVGCESNAGRESNNRSGSGVEQKVASLRCELGDCLSRERCLIERITKERRKAVHLSALAATKTHRLRRELGRTKSSTTRQSLRRKILRQNTLDVLDSLADAFSDIPEIEEEKHDECEWEVNTTIQKLGQMKAELGEKVVLIRDARMLLWDSFDGDASEIITSYSTNTLSSLEDVLRKVKEREHCISSTRLSCSQEKRKDLEKKYGRDDNSNAKKEKKSDASTSQIFGIMKKSAQNKGVSKKNSVHVKIATVRPKIASEKHGRSAVGRRIPCSMLA